LSNTKTLGNAGYLYLMADKNNFLEKYTEIYNKLNSQQKLAVDTIEGPVMVIGLMQNM
jgi:hypothetical protein